MATPHISAEKGDFAKTVLMPGDPLRAKFIADTFLKDVRQVTDVRGMLGFTGTYEGRPISVMAAAWGCPPSASIPTSCSSSTMWTTSSASAPPAAILPTPSCLTPCWLPVRSVSPTMPASRAATTTTSPSPARL